MKKLWLWSSGILAFQIAVFVGSLFLPFAEKEKYTVVLALTGAVTFVALLLGMFLLYRNRFGVAIWFTIFAASAGALALAFAMTGEIFLSSVIFVVTLVIASVVTFFAMDDDTITAPRWAYFVTALPLGFGFVAGGILCRVFREKGKKETENKPSVVPWPGSDTPAEQ